MRSARWPLLLCGALLGCERRAPPAASDPGDPAARAREAEAELRSLGVGRFAVDDFHVTSETRYTFRDDYEYPTAIVAVSFDARVHATQDFVVAGADELMARKATPDLSLPDLERHAALLNLFGGRGFHLGEQRTIEGSAAFDALEPGYRFRLFDRCWAPAP
jgi:hypothetical protein